MHSHIIASACAIALLFCFMPLLAAADEPALPAFLSKVQLHNFAGVELSEDGDGVKLYRVPAELRENLTEQNVGGTSSADIMRKAAHSEIRFVLNEGAKPEDVKIHLQATDGANVVFFWGDIFCGTGRIQPGGRAKPLTPQGHGLLYNLMNKVPAGRFPNHVCRIVLNGGELILSDIEGDIRPPRPDELPPVMVSYGTSISQGAAASRADLAWNALTAREFGYDLINLGSSGTAYCQPEMADYIASLEWELCVLEISVNMVGRGFTTEEFRERASYMIDTVARSNPDGHVVCISIFPYGVGDYWVSSPAHQLAKEFRQTLQELCEESPHKNVHFISGSELLSFTGLSADMLHPSDHGMIEIATRLADQLRVILRR